MTQEDKQLLLKDLCARLPYGVKVQHQHQDYLDEIQTIEHISRQYGEIETESVLGFVDDFKPYLRPMSSMTEDECITLSKLIPYETDAWKYIKTPIPLYIANTEQFDFFHSHHLDWRGLISKGLAIEVTEDNNPYKE